MKWAGFRALTKKTSKSISYINIVVSPDPLSLTPSPSSAVNAPENTEEDPEPSDGDIKTG
jgi:hypothetical protein